MRPENKEKREAQIIAAAYCVLESAGPAGLSMQAVAKQARASLETLYRWYGDKTGLYTALVAANAAEVEHALTQALDRTATPQDALVALGAQLYDMVTGERAVALNRAAAADPTGVLGQSLAEHGRGRVVPLIAGAIERMDLDVPVAQAAGLFVDLLLGDIQIRRATGTAPQPPQGTAIRRAEHAVASLLILCSNADLAGLSARSSAS